MKQPRKANQTSCIRVEALEGRQLLSANLAGVPWSPQTKLIGLDQAAANFPSITGAGETVAVIDSGVDYNHSQLGGGFGPGHKVIDGYNFVDNNGNPFNDPSNPHGTGSAGMVAGDPYVNGGLRYQGVAPGVNIVALRENSAYGTKLSLDWVLANKAKYNIVAVNVLNWGFDPTSTMPELQALHDQGVFVGSPSGNGGASLPANPYPNHVAFQAGATDVWGNVASLTSRGPNMDLLAPAENILIPWWWQGSEMDYPSTGTSWSSPEMVGAAALVKQVNPSFSADQVMAILCDSGTPTWDAPSGMSYPLLNVNNAIALAYQRSGKQLPAAAAPSPVPQPLPTPTPVVQAAPLPAPATFVTNVPPSVSPTGGSAPNTPFALAAAPAAGAVNLSFFDNSDNEAGFVVERSTGGAYTAVATLPASPGTHGKVSWSDNAVTPGTAYGYRVKAVAGNASSNYEGVSWATPSGPSGNTAATPVPQAAQPILATQTGPAAGTGVTPNGPFLLSAAPGALASVVLSFYSNSNNETGFIVERNDGTGFTPVATLPPAAGGAHSHVTWSDTNVAAGASYSYRVKAINGDRGSSYAGVASATAGSGAATNTVAPTFVARPVLTANQATTAAANGIGTPNSPFALSAGPAGASALAVSFFDNSDNETGFVVERSTDGANFSTIAVLPPSSGVHGRIDFTDTGVSSGTAYAYRVKAVNGDRSSPSAGVVTATAR